MPLSPLPSRALCSRRVDGAPGGGGLRLFGRAEDALVLLVRVALDPRLRLVETEQSQVRAAARSAGDGHGPGRERAALAFEEVCALWRAVQRLGPLVEVTGIVRTRGLREILRRLRVECLAVDDSPHGMVSSRAVPGPAP